MAEKKVAAVEDFLTCAVCLETFREPVSLSCNHSFCYTCLDNYWTENEKRCPVCRRRSSKGLFVNFALKELTLTFSEGHEGQPKVCNLHPQALPMFCKEELCLVCPVCELSEHKQHTVISVETAETELKKDLKTQLQAMKEQREQVQRLEQSYERIQAHSHKQVEQCEGHIRAVFSRLQNFLKEQEELSVSALRQEQHRQVQTIGPELESIREQLSSVDHSIQALERQMERSRGHFLCTYTQSPPQSLQQASPSPPQLGKGLLINQARVLNNLGFRVWEKMRDVVQYYPVVLDPNTANPVVSLCEDLTTLTFTDTDVDLPDHPDRFSEYPIVLGSEGFLSGTHSWEVEVADHPHWIIGVVRETVDRKSQSDFTPENGFWCLAFYEDEYSTNDETLTLKNHPQKIQVELDYSRGTVSVYDTSDMSLIYTHTATFTEKVYPLFYIGPANEANAKDIRICPKHELDQVNVVLVS